MLHINYIFFVFTRPDKTQTIRHDNMPVSTYYAAWLLLIFFFSFDMEEGESVDIPGRANYLPRSSCYCNA